MRLVQKNLFLLFPFIQLSLPSLTTGSFTRNQEPLAKLKSERTQLVNNNGFVILSCITRSAVL